MSLAHALATTAAFANPDSLDTFRSHLDPAWIEAALEATGVATTRRRRLPAEQVVWVVLGMAMFRDRSIEDVVSKLDLALPGAGTAARSSITQARARLGSEPMKWLFETSAAKWATEAAVTASWRGLALYGIDGSSLRVPDSDDNRVEFGGQSGRDGSESGYPLVRIVALMALRSHLLRGVSVSSYEGTSELGEAAPLFSLLPDASLTIVDRAYLAAAPLFAIQRGGTNRQWLTRAKASTAYRVLKRFKKGDELVEMAVSSAARTADPTLPKTFQARAIHYQRPGHKPSALLTSLLDPKAYPASELVALYHERWEIELGYDEIKTHMLDREETIRSRTPDGVRQELWGIFLAYNMIRLEMARTAAEAKVEPTRISFLESVRLIRSEWDWLAISSSPGAIGKHLRHLRESLKRYVLPPRRDRVSPRAVKIKMSGYPRKRPSVELAK
jgi:hypothetical protein